MAKSSIVQLSRPEPDIALLTLNDPDKGANVLSRSVLEDLQTHFEALAKDSSVTGVVVRSAKPGSFIVGADLREFLASLDSPAKDIEAMCRRGRTIFQWLSQMPPITVAAIDGLCLGGGAELAVWCDRRVMTADAKSQLGFPEVKLGLFPGWGGTARTSRIAGLGNAVEIVSSGESVDGRAARAMGLADDLATSDDLTAAAIRLIRAEKASGKYLEDRIRWAGPIAIDEVEFGFLAATASGYIQQQTKGKYPAPEAALEVILEGAMTDCDGACDLEAAGMAKLFGSPVNRALINVFFLTDRNKKDTGVDKSDVPTRKIESVGVIGAGIMGAGIVAANLKRDVRVALYDALPEAVASGVQKVLDEVAFNKQTRKADPDRLLKFTPLLRAGSDDEVAKCDLVVEAVVENPDVKRRVFSQLEPRMHDNAILSSNTSTIPITSLAEGLKRPEQFCGMHFFNPVRKMQLVEVIRGEKTSDETVATVVAHAKRIGKMPIVIKDGPGFLVNRLLFPYLNEALQLLLEGVEIRTIDRVSKDFGMPLGPIALYDVVGLDTCLYAGRVMYEAFPERTGLSPVLPILMKAGRLGQKSGAGFFVYKNRSERGDHDPVVDKLLEAVIRRERKIPEEEIRNRLFLPMVLEATRVLAAKQVRNVRDMDLGMIFGIGFPPFRGGLLFWADTLGAAKIVETLKPLEHLGERMQPTPLLLELAKEGKKFYDLSPA